MVIMPSFGTDEHVRAGTISRVLTDYELASFRLYVRYPSRRFLPAKVRSFLECLREHFGSDPSRDPWQP
jgi:DNA-binding transcriptional LysR family regulator